jgi:t-SNARE complex subunit (syntaxin)
LKARTTPDCRNTASTANREEEEIVDDPVDDGNASMPEQVKRPNPWKKKKMMMIIIIIIIIIIMTMMKINITLDP